MIDVSFIIVSWNAKDYLLECLESIDKTVTDQSYEVIVVDNGSTDGSPDAVTAQYPETQLIATGENLGFAKGNNVGLRASKGRYLCLLNSDTVLLPGTVKTLCEYMDANSSVGMASPRILNTDGSLQPTCSRFPRLSLSLSIALGISNLFPRSPLFGRDRITWWDYNEERFVDVLAGCFWFVRKEAFDDVGPLDETYFMYGEDFDWCKSFDEHDWKIALYPEAEAIHHGGGSSKNAPVRFYLARQEAQLLYWRKHHGRFSTALRAMVIGVHQLSRILISLPVYALFPKRRSDRAHKMHRSMACLRWLVRRTPNAPVGDELYVD